MTNPLTTDSVLTREQCAEALGISLPTLDKSGVPVSYALGERTPRYVWGEVVAWLKRGQAA